MEGNGNTHTGTTAEHYTISEITLPNLYGTCQTSVALLNVLPGKCITENNSIDYCPTRGRQFNGKAQLPKHRKNSPGRQQDSRGELNQNKKCPNEGCNMEFETIKDLEFHMRYRCGNEPNPFINTTRPGHLDRRTLHGYGIPPGDIPLFGDKILFGRTQMTWNCMICGYKGNQYERRQVYGHVRATHCYESRKPNGRWNIPSGAQFKEPKNRTQFQQ